MHTAWNDFCTPSCTPRTSQDQTPSTVEVFVVEGMWKITSTSSVKFAMKKSGVNAVEWAQKATAVMSPNVGIAKPMSILRQHFELKFSNVKS